MAERLKYLRENAPEIVELVGEYVTALHYDEAIGALSSKDGVTPAKLEITPELIAKVFRAVINSL